MSLCIGRSYPRLRFDARLTQFSSPPSARWLVVVSIARIGRPPFYRGGPASTETTPATSPSPSETARCASTEDHQAPSPPLFRGSFPIPLQRVAWSILY